jgi:hypothetical protein
MLAHMKAKKLSFAEHRDAAGKTAVHYAVERWTPVIRSLGIKAD